MTKARKLPSGNWNVYEIDNLAVGMLVVTDQKAASA